MSALQDALALLDGSSVDGDVVTCQTHLMSDLLSSGTGVTGDGGAGVFFDITVDGVSHRCTRISDTKHTVEVN